MYISKPRNSGLIKTTYHETLYLFTFIEQDIFLVFEHASDQEILGCLWNIEPSHSVLIHLHT